VLHLLRTVFEAADARVVHKDVEPAVIGCDIGEHLGHGCAVGDIEGVCVAGNGFCDCAGR